MRVVFAIFVVFLAVEARSGFVNGLLLYEDCNNNTPMIQNMCRSYIAGVADILEFNAIGERRACLPYYKVDQNKATEVVKAFLGAHPELRHQYAAGLVARALSEAFPCPPARAADLVPGEHNNTIDGDTKQAQSELAGARHRER